MDLTADGIIKKLKLEAHPEGGYFRETYRSEQGISEQELGQEYEGDRNYSTCIYFLLKAGEPSKFHKIKQDEVWHFYLGDTVRIHMLDEDGYSKVDLNTDIKNGQFPQYVVNGGSWFAAEVLNENSFALVGCTVAPGFDFKDFVLADKEELISQFPGHKEVINQFT